MQATETFTLRIEPKVKRILYSLALREGRSQAKVIKTLILREYENAQKVKPMQQPSHEYQPSPMI